MKPGTRFFCTVVLLGLVAALGTAPAHAEAPYRFDTTPGQLPKTIVPLDYRFHIAPDLAKLRFSGEETIRIQVREATREIVLNALDLDIRKASLGGNGLATQTLQPQLDAQKQTLRFALAEPLAPGEYTLAIDYDGRINAQGQGLFYTRYKDDKGIERTMLGTQMEPTDARRLLPCWDEPAFRATFQLSVDLPKELSVYSNMPAASTTAVSPKLQRVEFQRTPKMPSYLVVLVAGRLQRLVSEQDGVQIGIVTTEGKQASAAYALEATKQLLHYYNDYFGVPFPLPKLDQIAIPGGFAGAMENWGGITYIETALLYDPKTSSEETRQNIYSTLAHEMAHQWFGDLVTTAWWDNLWLNEGFASWMGTKATDHFNPGWRVWLQANGERERAMQLDARATTHPIQQPVNNESDANDAFDDITYLKGQSFLRMLESWLGEDVFRAGIRAYMSQHQYGNTTTADLWAALEAASGKPVARMSGGWTEQPGFPLLSVTSRCEDGTQKLALAQQQFHSDTARDDGRQWSVPLTLATLATPDRGETVLLDQPAAELLRGGCGVAVLPDPAAVGYFRMQLGREDLAALALRLPQLPDAARLKLLSDGWALAANGTQPLSALLDLYRRIGDEPLRAVWTEITGKLSTLDRMALGTPARAPLRQMAIQLIKPAAQRLGWAPQPGEDDETRLLRALLIGTLAEFGDAETIATARQRYAAYLKKPDSLPTSLVDTVVGIVGREADAKTWAQLRMQLDRARSTEVQRRYLEALCSVRDPLLAQRALPLALDEKLPPAVALVAPAVVAYGDNRELAWAWTKQHGDALLKRTTAFERNRYLGAVIGPADDAALADDFEAYAATKIPAESLTNVHRDADGIRTRAQIKARLLPQLQAALKPAN